MHVCCGLGWRFGSSSAEIECSNESSGQHTGSECASDARRATGLAETAGARRWVSSELSPTVYPGRFQCLEQGDLQEKLQMFNNMCITAVLLYHSIDIVDGRRGKKRKIRDYDCSTRTLTLTLIGTLWGDQCLDAVACGGARLIRPIWLVCLERLHVDSVGPGCGGSRNPRTLGITAV